MPKPNTKPAVLVVVANPYSHLDHTGTPNGAARLCPTVSGGMRLYIGAELKAEVHRKHPDGTSAEQTTWFEFSPDPVTIADNAWHRSLLKDGSVLPADKATADKCRVAFLESKAALEAAKAVAIAKWQAAYGDTAHNAHAELFALPEAPAPEPKKKAPAAAKES